MRTVYLASAARDIAWFRHYYRAVFPQGAEKAWARIRAIQRLLAENPRIGRRSDAHEGAREFPVTGTPFTIIYRLTETRIEILRLWDNRRDPGGG